LISKTRPSDAKIFDIPLT